MQRGVILADHASNGMNSRTIMLIVGLVATLYSVAQVLVVTIILGDHLKTGHT
jgi:hypothetical protein